MKENAKHGFGEKLLLVLALCYAWRDRKRIFIGLHSDVGSQALYHAAPLMPGFDPREKLTNAAPFVAQALNFFIISPLDSEEIARQQIELMLCKETSSTFKSIGTYAVLHEENFHASKLVAGVALLLHSISEFLFDHKFSSEKDFEKKFLGVVTEVKSRVLEKYPELSDSFNLFLKYFKGRYMSPWNTSRFSNRKTRANFGTGVDYITIP